MSPGGRETGSHHRALARSSPAEGPGLTWLSPRPPPGWANCRDVPLSAYSAARLVQGCTWPCSTDRSSARPGMASPYHQSSAVPSPGKRKPRASFLGRGAVWCQNVTLPASAASGFRRPTAPDPSGDRLPSEASCWALLVGTKQAGISFLVGAGTTGNLRQPQEGRRKGPLSLGPHCLLRLDDLALPSPAQGSSSPRQDPVPEMAASLHLSAAVLVPQRHRPVVEHRSEPRLLTPRVPEASSLLISHPSQVGCPQPLTEPCPSSAGP